MTADEVIAALKAYVDKKVVLTFSYGETQAVYLINVDDEGVVYDLVIEDRRDAKNAWWTTFGDIVDVQPIPGNKE